LCTVAPQPGRKAGSWTLRPREPPRVSPTRLEQDSRRQATFVGVFAPASVNDGRLWERRTHRPVHSARILVVGDDLRVEPAPCPVTAYVDEQALEEHFVEAAPDGLLVRPLRIKAYPAPHEVDREPGEDVAEPLDGAGEGCQRPSRYGSKRGLIRQPR
jgi:hypothetical protein